MDDFVAHTSDMKRLFMIPYATTKVSMAVHRVGNTLFLDGRLDGVVDSVEHGREGTVKQFKSSHGKNKRDRNKHNQLEKPLQDDKFLYCSVGDSLVADISEKVVLQKSEEEACVTHGGGETPKSSTDPSQDISRVVHWRFKELDMLLGSDLLIFGNSVEGAPSEAGVSVRLQDCEKEITSLACLDYWLDNIMAGVSETAICYHKEGHVQGYSLVKTEDLLCLPSVKASFKPASVVENAHSVLEFLHTNCVHEASTYWLVKEEGSNEVQIYELGTDDDRDEPECGGSAVSGVFNDRVAMLCLSISDKIAGRSEQSNVLRYRALLARAARLLDRQSHKAECIAAHEKWVATVSDRCLAAFEEENVIVSSQGMGRKNSNDSSISAAPLPPLTIEEVQEAISHLQSAMALLDVPDLDEGGGISTAELAAAGPRLCRKAKHLCVALALLYKRSGQFGFALGILHGLSLMLNLQIRDLDDRHLLAYVFSMCGDLFFELSRVSSADEVAHLNAEKSRGLDGLDDLMVLFNTLHERGAAADADTNVRRHEQATAGALGPLRAVLAAGVEENLMHSIRCCLRALHLLEAGTVYHPISSTIERAYDELGQYYLSQGRFTKAHSHFEQGVSLFRSLGPQQHTMVAQLLCALGRVMLRRLAGHPMASNDTSGTVCAVTKEDYLKAVDVFRSAKDTLKTRKAHTEVWSSCCKELANCHMAIASEIEKKRVNHDLYHHEVERELTVHLTEAVTMFREAGICPARAHHRLGSVCLRHVLHLNMSHARDGNDETRRKSRTKWSLASTHLLRALELIDYSNDPVEYVRASLELSRLHRHAQGPQTTALFKSLNSVLETRVAFGSFTRGHRFPPGTCPSNSMPMPPEEPKNYSESVTATSDMASSQGTDVVQGPQNQPVQNSDPADATGRDHQTSTLAGLFGIVEEHVHTLLKDLIKLHSPQGSSHSPQGSSETVEALKDMYRTALTNRSVGPQMLHSLAAQLEARRVLSNKTSAHSTAHGHNVELPHHPLCGHRM